VSVCVYMFILYVLYMRACKCTHKCIHSRRNVQQGATAFLLTCVGRQALTAKVLVPPTYMYIRMNRLIYTYMHIHMQCGMTALLLVCEAGHEETAKLLVPPTLAAGLLDARSIALTGLVGNYAGYSALLWAKERALAGVVECCMRAAWQRSAPRHSLSSADSRPI